MFCIKKGIVPKWIILTFFMFLLMPVRVEASSFYHTHSDSCYTTGTLTCSNHRITQYTTSSLKHCFSCGVQTYFTIVCYSDTCENNLIAPRQLGFCEICGVCGGLDKNDNVSLLPPHTYTGNVLACTLPEGTSLGTVTISPSETGWTNAPVTLTAGVTGMAANFSLAAAPYNFGNGYSCDPSLTVSSNGSYSVTVMGSDGGTASSMITVSNIDTTSPTLSLSKSAEAWTEGGIDITASGSDSESGLPALCYSFDGGAYTSDSKLYVTSNRTVTVSVIDNAGNVTTQSITVSNIGKDPSIVAKEQAEKEKAEAEKKAREEAEKKAREEAEKRAEEESKKQGNGSATTGNTNSNTGESKGSQGAGGKGNSSGTSSASDGKTGSSATSSGKDTTGAGNEDTDSRETAESNPDAGSGQDGVIVSSESAGSLSGILKVTDTTASEGVSGPDGSGEEPEPVTQTAVNGMGTAGETSDTKQSEGKTAGSSQNMPIGEILIYVGVILVGIAGLLFLSSNYVYTMKNGHAKLVSPVKIKKKNKRMVVEISEKKLQPEGKYYIFFSPFNRILKKKNRVYVMVKEKNTMINTDEGASFTY